MRRAVALLLVTTACGVGAGALTSTASAAPATGQISIVQAVPGQSVAVSVAGRSVSKQAAAGSVLGPITLPAGSRTVTFVSGGNRITTRVAVRAGGASDVVLHLPEQSGAAPVVNTYAAPTGAIGPGKSRVLVAHTANVGAVDVSVDDKTVFTGVTNGAYATADLPAGAHDLALVSAGTGGATAADQVLGPLDLATGARTLTMVYAYGDPADDTMRTITDTRRLAADGSVVPTTIHTGSAGLVGDATSFGVGGSSALGSPVQSVLVGLVAAAGAAAAFAARARRRTPALAAPSRHAAGSHRP